MAGRTSRVSDQADHGANEPEGNDDGRDGKNAADHGGEVAFREGGDGDERVDGNADGAEGDRSGVGDEIESGGLKRLEAEADHEGAGDGDGRAETRAAFDEGAETKSDEEKLEATIGSDGGDGLLHDFKLAGFDGDVVEEDGGDDDPDDFEEAVGGTVEEAGEGELARACGRRRWRRGWRWRRRRWRRDGRGLLSPRVDREGRRREARR